jgi:uncharacterized protein (TIGR02246 family)
VVLATSPQEAVALADAAFNRGDIDAMLEFYEADAVLLFEPGRAVRGRAALADALRSLLTSRPTAAHRKQHVIEAGDLALWTSQWSVTGTAPDGSPMSVSGCNSVVFRRGADGGWRVAVENPWGSAILDVPAASPSPPHFT